MSKALKQQTVTVSLPPQHYQVHNHYFQDVMVASEKSKHTNAMSRDHQLPAQKMPTNNTTQETGGNYHHRIGNALLHQTYAQEGINSSVKNKASQRRKKVEVNTTNKKSVPKSIIHHFNPKKSTACKLITKEQLMQIVKESSPEVFNVVSQFNGGIFTNGNFTHRSSVDSHLVIAGRQSSSKRGKKETNTESKQLAYQKQKRDASVKSGTANRGIKTSQSQSRKVIGAQSESKAQISSSLHVKGSQSQYTSASGMYNQQQQQTRPTTNALSSLNSGASPPQSIKARKQQQRSPLLPRHLIMSNASANNKALNVKELQDNGSPPPLNYNHYHHVHSAAKPKTQQQFLNRDSSPPTQTAAQSSISKKSQIAQQKFVKATQTPLKSQQALSLPSHSAAHSSKKQQQPKIKDNLSKQVLPGAGTFDMQIKRQQKNSLASPPPKKKGASRTNNGQKPILSTVPKKASKSKVNLSSGTGGQSNSCNAKKTTQSSTKFEKGGRIAYLNNGGSPSPTIYNSKAYDLHKVSEEKMGSGGSNGSYIQQFNPSNFLAPSHFNVQANINNDMLPVVSRMMPQLNQIQIPALDASNAPQSSPIINIKKKLLNQPPPQVPTSTVDSIHLKSQSHSVINRNIIEKGISPAQQTILAKQQSAKDPQRVGEVIVVDYPKEKGSMSPQQVQSSPFSKQSQQQSSSFTKAVLEQWLSSTQPQNKELLNSILIRMNSESKKQSPIVLPRPAEASPKISNDNQELKTPVNQIINALSRRRSSSKSDKQLQSPLVSSSAPPSSSSSGAGAIKKQPTQGSDLKPIFVTQYPAYNDLTSPQPPILNPFTSHKSQSSLNQQLSHLHQHLPLSSQMMTPNQFLYQQVPQDKENAMILSNNTDKKMSLNQQSTKVTLKYKKEEEQPIVKKGQKTTKKENDENNAPLRFTQKPAANGIMGSSVSIFHQVLSETPLRRKNSGEKTKGFADIFSNQKEPLREINFHANHQMMSNPQTLKSGFDKKQFDLTVGDFQANATEKTPQPKENMTHQVQRIDQKLHQQLIDGILSAQTPNPFINIQQQLPIVTQSSNSSYHSLGAAKKILSSSSYSDEGFDSDGQRPLPQLIKNSQPDMIILDQRHLISGEKIAFELRKKSIDNLSERSDLKSNSSRGTVVPAQNQLQVRENMTFTIDSSDKRFLNKNVNYEQARIQRNTDLIVSSCEKSRTNKLQQKMPSVVVPGTQIPSIRDNPLMNPLIYQGDNSYQQSIESSMSESSSYISSNDERGMKQLNNSMADAEDMQRMIESKLHYIQFEKVFCNSNYRRDDLMAYFIRRHQIQMGLIPPKDHNDSCCSSTDENLSGMSNFSLEIEMLNKLHVEKNNRNKLSQLPVVIDHLLPDPSLSLYIEEPNENGICFSKDERPRIHFKDPITKTKNQMIRYNQDSQRQDLFEGSLTQKLKHILPIQHQRSGSSQCYQYPAHNGATGLDDYNFHDKDLCLKMENRYYESSEEEGAIPQIEGHQYHATKQSCSCSNGRSDGHMCIRCQRNQAAIIKRKDYYSSSSSAIGGASSSFSDKPKKCRRRIDKQFTSSGDFQNCPVFEQFIPDTKVLLGDNQVIDLQDIRVQPFGGWGDEALFSEEEKIQPAIIRTSQAEPKMKINFDQMRIQHNEEVDFDRIPEISHLSDHTEMMAHLYQRQNDDSQSNHLKQIISRRQSHLNQDLELQYLEQLEIQRLQLQANQNSRLSNNLENHHSDQQTSYDMAIKDYKWLHETNHALQQQDALDQILMMSGPAGALTNEIINYQQQISSNATQDNQWLMRPIEKKASNIYQQEPILQFQMTGGNGKALVGSGDSSPMGEINRAPVKGKRAQQISQSSQSSMWSSSQDQKQKRKLLKSAQSSSSGFGRMSRPDSDKVALALFSNPQVLQNIEQSRKLFEGCESIKSSNSFQSQASSTQGIQLSFESKEEAQLFIQILKTKLNIDPNIRVENLKILPGIKTLQAHEIIRVEAPCSNLKPALFDQVPMCLKQLEGNSNNEKMLEMFDFDQLLAEIEHTNQMQQQQHQE